MIDLMAKQYKLPIHCIKHPKFNVMVIFQLGLQSEGTTFVADHIMMAKRLSDITNKMIKAVVFESAFEFSQLVLGRTTFCAAYINCSPTS